VKPFARLVRAREKLLKTIYEMEQPFRWEGRD
jgi:hypothetical protein